MFAKFAIAVLCAAAAWGQTTAGQNGTQVFHFTHAQGPVEIQEITNAIRSVPEIRDVYPNADAKTLAVTGTADQLAMASFIFTTLDQPAPADRATREFRPAGTTNDVLRVMYLTHQPIPASFQEVVNAVRTIPEMYRVFPYVSQSAVVIRGTENQVAMTEWLFHQLDLPAGVQPVQSLSAHHYATPGATNDEVQVFFLSHPWSLQGMQQIVNAVRTIPELTKVFPCTASGAVAVRGATAKVALAAWLFSQLDAAPPASAAPPQAFQMPGADDVTQVFYLGPGTSAASLQSVVTAVRASMQRPVFPNTALNALVLRGTASQIASADVLIQQMNQP